MGVPDHECVKDESFKELTKEFKELTTQVNQLGTDIALFKRDITDLKQVTVAMSECIRALTETAIKAGENNITRGQFYEKMDEINKSREAIVEKSMKEFHDYVELADKRFEALEKQAQDNKTVCSDYKDTKKLVYGIIASIVVIAIAEAYRLLIHA